MMTDENAGKYGAITMSKNAKRGRRKHSHGEYNQGLSRQEPPSKNLEREGGGQIRVQDQR
jgi:hypothetical protein